MDAIKQIQVMEQRLLNAMLNSDVDELNLLISDQVVVSGIDGRLSNKTDDIAAHQNGLLRIMTMIPQETTVQQFSGVVIVFALMSMQGNYQGQAFSGRFRYTRVWHNQDGNWQIVAAHISSMPD
ncbi:nuclear transport factor 2 family protein [Dyadobacter sp. CY107]|uniref:nuclear transport factor 2 family protein n=1 Tax=Dyadobacter fanqingshengii TaxID=2906443 RepID=UPI001F434123|nr:nuclear transport factor 2 family protein [Dyadobacter fanqingshengii]MCF2502097.1 nuclear transport factor 2 family protein [Dyadobacter fanqingshengii]